MTVRNGLASLLRPQDSVLVLIDHQPYQLANLNSHDPHMVVNNSAALAKAAKVFNVPTILTSVVAARGGNIFPQITDVFPGYSTEIGSGVGGCCGRTTWSAPDSSSSRKR
jgi:nicotinamidase-related amidase